MTVRKTLVPKNGVKREAIRDMAGSTLAAGKKADPRKANGQGGKAMEMLHDIERRAKVSIDRAHAVIAKLA